MLSRKVEAVRRDRKTSPESLLQRLAPVVRGLVALAHRETRKQFGEVRKTKRTTKEERGELGVDDNHRKWSFPPAEMWSSDEQY